MGTSVGRAGAFFIAAVLGDRFRHLSHRRATLGGVQPFLENPQVFREGRYMMIVISGIGTQVVMRELAHGPGLVKRMAQQIVLRNAGIQLLPEVLHDISPLL